MIQFLDEEEISKPLPVFKWLPIHNVTYQDHCRNSQQGSSLIVDELGVTKIHHTKHVTQIHHKLCLL